MWSTQKTGACIKECITADREMWERKRPSEKKPEWEWSEQKRQRERKCKRVQLCCGLGFDFPMIAEKEEMQYSAVTLLIILYLRWGGNRRVTFKHPRAVLDIKETYLCVVLTCPWHSKMLNEQARGRVQQSHSTVHNNNKINKKMKCHNSQ